ncbi:SDR family oxidoreductase [Alicyclobacillus sp. ALC3]|uniref:SDR family oxidoreductase n=1 Tax=Alicyclobacillus sp. ALC3 TaxID=2796143 RepID=UPI00237921CB|nr:SDR family oxidoreductase [Alicyclobacillus sp. ALC3]WDL98559.1 SDR family oxidoreductase [Alicyclobacillus sp. ALC3]
MRVFVTGATGYIGSAVVLELLNVGHQVVGLTRSDHGAAMLDNLGAEVHRGDLDDLDSLRSGVAAADGVIHLAFKHDFSDFAGSLACDLRAVQAMGTVLEGSDKPYITTVHANGEASDNVVLELANRMVRSSVVSLSPTVHGEGDKAFVPTLINIARTKGVSAYIDDGANRWPAVHRLDAANLYRLALEKAPAGSQLYGRAEEEIPFRDIAEVIGKHLKLPVVSISREEADAHFGFLGTIVALDIPTVMPGSSAETRSLLDWKPKQTGLIADLEEGHYFND